ncbi:MAG: 5-(carboxyamino)imidazole ribonucleotide synthase, partial [Pseudomonadota bacterium]
GQLGRMLGLAGLPLGVDFVFLDPAESPCATFVGEHLRAPYDDPDALAKLSAQCDVVTCEFENVPAGVFDILSPTEPHPAKQALHIAQERAREKTAFEAVGIPVAPWRCVENQSDVDQAIEDLGLPLIAKTRTMGYDGKGQQRVRAPEDATDLFEQLGNVPLLMERLVPFDSELSVVGTRAVDGSKVIFPLSQNVHRDGILHRSEQAHPDQSLQRQARKHFAALTDSLNYVGTLAIEFFVSGGLLLGNEFAPRVHNSGHWTQDGMPHDQFENHIRAVCGMPVGAGSPYGHSGMINLIGQTCGVEDLLGHSDVHIHLYGKSPRPGRKLGHVNVLANSASTLRERLNDIAAHLDRAYQAQAQQV